MEPKLAAQEANDAWSTDLVEPSRGILLDMRRLRNETIEKESQARFRQACLETRSTTAGR